MSKQLLKSLYFWVIVGIVAGVTLGHVAPEYGQAMRPLGDAFIKLIKMLIAPVIFCTITTGIAGMRSLKNAGRVGFKALLYFEVLSTVALLIGLVVANVMQPGAQMHIDPVTLDVDSVSAYTHRAEVPTSPGQFLLQLIPSTFADPFVSGNMLQLLLVSALFAVGLLSLGNRGYQVTQLVQQLSDILFKIIGIVVKASPIGAFGAMAFTVGTYGIGTLTPMLHLMLGFYATCLLFIFIALGGVMRLCGLRLWLLLRYIREELLIVLGTSSSEAALPRLMEKMTALGCSRAVVGMVVPTGYSFNLDGTAIYLTLAALFIAQALGIPLSLGDQLLLLAVLLLTSKGAAGVTGSGFVVLAATLSAVGHIPVAGVALILGVDRFMSEARALTNFIGNAVATVVVARWEGAVDMAQARHVLGQPVD